MYRLKAGDTEYTIPKANIVPFALIQALDRGITHGNIHDDITAIAYLEEIGIKVTDGGDKE